MNKKFLSAILFGALMVTSTGTFVSCSDDYDDDIARIDQELTDIKSQIAALQTKIDAGKYVTGVTTTADGLTITLSDGTSYNVTNGKDGAAGAAGEAGEDGKDGDKVEVKDGYWVINGEVTEYVAVTKDQLGQAVTIKTPIVNEDGFWVFYNEKGEAQVSTVKAASVTAVHNDDQSWTLTVYDKDGGFQTINLPTAASLISGINILDDNKKPTADDQTLAVKYWVHATASRDWDGPRGKIPAKSILYSAAAGDADICFNLDPSNVDATEMAFALVNTLDGKAPLELVAPADYKDLLTRAAAYDNGIFTTGVGTRSKIFAYSYGESDFTGQLKISSTENIIFALTPNVEGLGVRSPYQFKVNATKQNSATLSKVVVTGVDKNADEKKYALSISSGGSAIIKVGVKAPVTALEEYNLYDLYMTVTDAAKDKFGLLIDNENRTITATKSPDDLTDADFDLVVKAMDNAGDQYVTTIKVTVNRTLGEGTYDKQEKDLAKRNDIITVSAEPLFASLDGKVSDWKESVDLAYTDFELLDDRFGYLASASEGQSSFVSRIVANTIASNGQANGRVAFLNSDNELSTPATLANIRFSFDIPTAAVDAPIKIGKTYYIRLTFRGKDANNTVLNTIVVPFVLNKPELSSILVKETGVFVDGDDLAHAYMNAVDAKWATGTISSDSRYYIDRAFTNMYKNLEKVGDYAFEGLVDVENKPANYYKEVEVANRTASTAASPNYSKRNYIQLRGDYDGDGIYDGYKKDLNVRFTGHYLAVQDASYYYKQDYQFRVMSPILEGEAVAANNIIEVSATGKTKIYREDLWAKTYNNDVKYDIFKTKNAYVREDIAAVTVATGNINVFQVTQATPTNQKFDGTTLVEDSYVEVEGVTENTSKLLVYIKDIWGYTLSSSVDIKTTLNTGK